jgi:hypothetical protein
MNEGPVNPHDMIETSDSLEAVGVFRGWKNLFFVVALVCLLLTQAAFWLVNAGVIKTPGSAVSPVAAETTPPGAATATVDTNDTGAAGATGGASKPGFFERLDFGYLARTVGLINGILLAAVMLYSLTLLASLTISLAGRLGGINSISRAFILSLIVLVLTVPWQALGLSIIGVIWTPAELVRWFTARHDNSWNLIIYYLRFTVYWALVLVLLVLAQVRSTHWSSAILHRLEII